MTFLNWKTICFLALITNSTALNVGQAYLNARIQPGRFDFAGARDWPPAKRPGNKPHAFRLVRPRPHHAGIDANYHKRASPSIQNYGPESSFDVNDELTDQLFSNLKIFKRNFPSSASTSEYFKRLSSVVPVVDQPQVIQNLEDYDSYANNSYYRKIMLANLCERRKKNIFMIGAYVPKVCQQYEKY